MRGRRDATAINIDRRVGRTIKELRMLLGLTQTVVASRIGVTFQQHQKYEEGTNRVSASRLYLVAEALGVEIDDLFRGVGAETTRKQTAGRQATDSGLPMKRETLQLFRYAAAIPSDNRRALIAFAKASQAMIEDNTRRTKRDRKSRPGA